IGIKESKGRYVLLLNPDAEVKAGTFSILVNFADANPGAGLIGPKILNKDGSLQSSARRFPTPLAALFRNTFLGRLFPNNQYVREYLMADWDHSSPREVDWLSGAALMLRRAMLDEIGLLDERFFMYCEDVDIAYRAKQKGWKAIYCPEAQVVHFLAKASDQAPNKMILTFHKSMYAFYKKHYAAEWSLPMRIITPIGIFARATLFIANNYIHIFLRLLIPKDRRQAKQQGKRCESDVNFKEQSKR
ncbi:MAG: glycosyltransferase family 2 protein, partial [Armatimonadota bacterium]|nr:glycosyltransferase family 2 protein [Armatimonadota bacterium]